MTSRRVALAGFSGLLLGLTFPNASLVLLLPVALVPLMLAVRGRGVREAFGLAYLSGFVFWTVTVPWIAYTVHRYGEVGWPLAAVALVLTSALLAVAFGGAGAFVAYLAPRSAAGRVLVWPAVWALQEGLRTYFFTGFPWALAGYALADHPALIQSAALGSVFLTSFLVVLVNAAVAEAYASPAWRARTAWLAGALLLVLGAAGLGAARVRWVASRTPSSTLRVGLVQTGVEQETRWAPGTRERIYEDLIRQTRELCRRERPELVMWPESASPYEWSWSARYRLDVPFLCRELGTAILLSTPWSDRPDQDDAPYYNAALLVTADGPVLPPYAKQRLVPFGEYVPLPWLLRRIGPITRAVPGGFTPGTEATLLPLRGLKLGGAVCYEVIYPWIARVETRRGADVLFTLTNDAWYGTLGAKRQHWQGAVFRAVETGRPLLRAAVTGITGWMDAAGRTTQVSTDGARDLVVDVPVGAVPPPFATRAGDAVLWICAAGVAIGILTRLRRARREPAGS